MSYYLRMVKHVGVIDRLSNTSFDAPLVLCVQNHELVTVHRDQHVVLRDEGTDASELIPELFLLLQGTGVDEWRCR